jgi:hypothetical protein
MSTVDDRDQLVTNRQDSDQTDAQALEHVQLEVDGDGV